MRTIFLTIGQTAFKYNAHSARHLNAEEENMKNSELLTVGQVANEWQCSPDTVRRLADGGRLPAIRVGREGHRLFNRSDVERVAAEREAKAEH